MSKWRYRCPEGHTSLKNRLDGYRCTTCKITYSGAPVDMKREGLADA